MNSIQTDSRIQDVINCLLCAIILIAINSVVLHTAFAQDDDLPVEIQADLIMKSAKKNMVAEKWDATVMDFEKLMKLGIELPDAFHFNYGKVLFKAGKYGDSLVYLKKYIKSAGREGKYYSDALDIVVEAKEKKNLAEGYLKNFNENMVLVKAGCFKMGDTFGDGFDLEKPVHEVCVDDFYIGKHNVTVGEFRQFVRETRYKTEAESDETGNGMDYWTGSEWKYSESKYWDNPGFSQTNIHPVVGVSWNDSKEYIKWLNKKAGMNFRLPTEAEWEYAARSGGKREEWAGTSSESELGRYAWYKGNSGRRTHPVGQKRPNALGLYDMSGNVWEWCQDRYDRDYYKNSPKNNPKGPLSGSYRVIRGGSWFNLPGDVRVSNRDGVTPDGRYCGLGFRLARTP